MRAQCKRQGERMQLAGSRSGWRDDYLELFRDTMKVPTGSGQLAGNGDRGMRRWARASCCVVGSCKGSEGMNRSGSGGGETWEAESDRASVMVCELVASVTIAWCVGRTCWEESCFRFASYSRVEKRW